MSDETSTSQSPTLPAPLCYVCQATPVAVVFPAQFEYASAGNRLIPEPPRWKCGTHLVEDLKLGRRVQPLLMPIGRRKPGRPRGGGASWARTVGGARLPDAIARRSRAG